MGEWGVALNGVAFGGGDGTLWSTIGGTTFVSGGTPACSGVTNLVLGCLADVPDGLDLPDIRSEEVQFPQQDGIQHFSDWYQPRIVSMQGVSVQGDGCGCAPAGSQATTGWFGTGAFGAGVFGGASQTAFSAKQKVRKIINAWSRSCNDIELVVYTNCHTMDVTGQSVDRATNGPFGIVGRPRMAKAHWQNGIDAALMDFRFDAVDHRMYILDQCGTPGSGADCKRLYPVTNTSCRKYPRCYTGSGDCYSTPVTGAAGPVPGSNVGDLCGRPTFTLSGPLTNPRVDDLTNPNAVNAQYLKYNTFIPAGVTVTIDTVKGTAVDSTGAQTTWALSGNLNWLIQPGYYNLRLTSYSSSDTGYMDMCYRPAVAAA